MQMLDKAASLSHPLSFKDEVIDLGSGLGKVVLQVLLGTEAGRVRGVELSSTRHGMAVAALARLLDGEQDDTHDNLSKQHVNWNGRLAVVERGDLFGIDLR